IRNPQSEIRNQKNRGRVDIRRETGGRGGKTVTVIDGFVGIGLPEKETLAKKMRAACGCGGTVKDGQIEIQGDQRETVAKILSAAGFRRRLKAASACSWLWMPAGSRRYSGRQAGSERQRGFRPIENVQMITG